MNARNSSTKSWFMGFASQAPDLLAEAPDVQHALGTRHSPPVFQIVAIGFGRGLESLNRDGWLPPLRHDSDYATAVRTAPAHYWQLWRW